MEDTSMDAQTMLIVVVIFIISAVILYLMSVYGFREKSYDEVILEQQRMLAEEEISKKDKKDNKKKKTVKKTVKREKVTTTIVQEETEKKKDEEVTKMVQLELDAEIIEPVQAVPEKDKKSHVPKKIREKEKEKAKSILTNKEERSLVKETVAVRETIHTGPLPKDEVELHHERHVIQGAPEPAPAQEQSNKKKRDKRAPKEEAKKQEDDQVNETVVVHEKVVLEEAASVKSEPPKKKKDRTPPMKAAGDNSTPGAKEDSDDWIKKSKQGDPIALLKRQLEEKERALAEEQQGCLGAKMKVKEIHQELTNERNRYLMLEAQSKQNLQKQAEEIKALHARMQQTHEQHHAEVNAMKYQLEQLGAQLGNEGAAHRIQRLEQENKQLQEAVGAAQAAARNTIEATGLQQQIKILQDELQKNVGKLTMAENAREKLDARLKKADNAQKETEAMFKKRMAEMSEALKHMENKNKSMSHDLDAATGTLAKRENELMSLRNQLKDMEKGAASHNDNIIRNLENELSETKNQRAGLEEQLRKVQQMVQEVEAKSGHKDDELKMLMNENAALKEELKSSRQRTSGEGQEAAVVREEPCGQVQAQKMTYDTNNIVKEKEAALANLQQELKQMRMEKDTMVNQMQVELQKLQSERDNLQMSSKTTESAVSQLQDQLNKMQSEKERAVIQLQKIQQEKETMSVQLQVASKDQGTAVNKLQEEIRKLQAENSATVNQLQADLQKVKQEKDELSNKLQASSKGQDSAAAQMQEELKKLTADLEKQRAKNNALREKNWKAMDALSKAEKMAETATDLKSSLANKDSEIDRLKTLIKQNEDNKELQQKDEQLKELQLQVSSRTDQLTVVQQQLQQLQASHDELRTKSGGQDGVDSVHPSDQKVVELQAQIETLQKENARVEAQAASVDTEAKNTIQDLRKQVEQLRSELAEKTSAIDNLQQQHNKDIQSKSAELEQQNVTLNARLSEAQTELAQTRQQLEAEVNRLKAEAAAALESKPTSSPADLQRIQTLEQDLSQRDASISELRSQLDSVNSQLSELLKNQQRNEESQAIAAKSMQELAQIKNDFNARLAEFERTKQELELLRKENHDLRLGCEKATRALTKAERSAEEIAQIQRELTSKVSEVHTLRASLEQKDKLIHELREKNSKAMDTMLKGPSSDAKSDASSDKHQRAMRELLQRLFPHVTVKSSLGHSEWMSAFEKEASKYLKSQSASNQSSDIESQLEEYRQNQGKLQAQVQHYKSVLAETEGILNKLQSSVENEETKWQQRVKTAEDDASKAKEEISRLKSQLDPRGPGGKELESLKTELEEERRSKRELAKANVKLNGMLRVGQDALRAEQEAVSKLQAQIAERSKGMANGTGPVSEIRELKDQLSQTKKQLEREAFANKQLSQKLAASVASTNGEGTSV